VRHRAINVQPVVGRYPEHRRTQEDQSRIAERASDQDRAYRQAGDPGEDRTESSGEGEVKLKF